MNDFDLMQIRISFDDRSRCDIRICIAIKSLEGIQPCFVRILLSFFLSFSARVGEIIIKHSMQISKLTQVKQNI